MKFSSTASRRPVAAAFLVFGAIVASSAPIVRGGGWVPLGTAHEDGHADHDKIKVGGSHGSFTALRLRVIGSPVKFDHLVVHLENGQSEPVNARFVVRGNSSSPAIPLAGARREIDSVELWYERGNWSDKPEVALLGRR
jgi:hypothetical protein